MKVHHRNNPNMIRPRNINTKLTDGVSQWVFASLCEQSKDLGLKAFTQFNASLVSVIAYRLKKFGLGIPVENRGHFRSKACAFANT
jgi:hypothetical protein